MTEAELEVLLKAGEAALESDPYCLCHDQTVASVTDIVGRAVLHAAAEKIRAHEGFGLHETDGAEAAADLIDPKERT